jgi:hypothetical protein
MQARCRVMPGLRDTMGKFGSPTSTQPVATTMTDVYQHTQPEGVKDLVVSINRN